MMGLFDDLPEPERRPTRPNVRDEYRRGQWGKRPVPSNWTPPEIPELHGEKRIILNAETTGLKWWAEDRPIGWSYVLPESGRRGYLPIRHDQGAEHNLPLEQVSSFLGSLRGMHVDNINTKFDLHMARADGSDLVEGTGNTFGDAAFYAALLDDHRMRFNLDQLSLDKLGWDVHKDGIGKKPDCIDNESEFRYLHPGEVAPFAIRNVDQVEALIDHFKAGIAEENLFDVLQLEEDVLPVVVEMEKNGTYLDMELLHEWQGSAQRDLEEQLLIIRRASGVDITSPDSPSELERVFEKCGLPIVRTGTGRPSFTEAYIQTLDHPVAKAIIKAGHLADFKSKYADKYASAADSFGWLRFNLHQLRSTGDGESKKGTVSGRFSAAGDKNGGYNPQQVVAVEKQLERGWLPEYVVRRLIVPGPGEVCLYAADMMQVEYRLFAHYANDPNILEVYRKNPLADYHKVVMELLHRVAPHLNRKLVKNVNFAKIYGAGLVKFALMIGSITEQQFIEFSERLQMKDWSVMGHPALAEAKKLNDDYNKMFPAVKPLLDRAAETARQRGYVMTLLGRRARLTGRFHSSLNRIIQGGAADINKRLLIELYKMRKELGIVMRLTVHDEVMGGLFDRGMQSAIDKLLNTQYFDLRVPILWDSKVGANWAACK